MLEYLLQDLVGIPSETGQEMELALYCEKHLQRAGFKTQHQPVSSNRFNLIAEKGSGPWSLLLYAHLDTVPAAPGWSDSPYTLRQEGDKLYGLGTSDMLAGIAIILSAAAQANPQAYCLKIALCVDEEAWSRGAWQFVSSDFCKDIAGVLVPELSVDSEQEVLGLGRLGHHRFTINCYGQRQHAAMKQSEPSAIKRAAHLITALEAFPLLENPQWGQESLKVRGINAKAHGLTIPASCSLELSFFSLPDHSEEEILSELNQFILPFAPHIDIEQPFRPTPIAAGYQIDPNHPFVSWVQQNCEQEFGSSLPIAYGSSVADENILANQLNVPVLSLAPVGGRSHQVEEWVSKKSIQKIEHVYCRLLDSANALP